MSFLKRLFSLASAEVNAGLDKLEDPVRMTEQGIRELKKDLSQALQNYAEVKSMTVKAQRDMSVTSEEAKEWEGKAIVLLQQAESGQMSTEKAEHLAGEALERNKSAMARYHQAEQVYQNQTIIEKDLRDKLQQLKSLVAKYESELATLKARQKTATATKKINQQLSRLDSSSTVSMLDRMKTKVENEEHLAIAYRDMAAESTSVEDEINQAIHQNTKKLSTTTELEALKQKIGWKKHEQITAH